MRNIYSDLMVKCFQEKKKIYIFLQISAVCIGVCLYMHAAFLVEEIADRFLGRALYG